MQSPQMASLVEEGMYSQDPETGQWMDTASGMGMQDALRDRKMKQRWGEQRQKGIHFYQDAEGNVQSKSISQMTPEEAKQHGIPEQERVQRRQEMLESNKNHAEQQKKVIEEQRNDPMVAGNHWADYLPGGTHFGSGIWW
jgi:hypothetical protein